MTEETTQEPEIAQEQETAQEIEQPLLELKSQCAECDLESDCKVKSHSKNFVIVRCIDKMDYLSGKRNREEILEAQV